jgi:hypothetical protein
MAISEAPKSGLVLEQSALHSPFSVSRLTYFPVTLERFIAERFPDAALAVGAKRLFLPHRIPGIGQLSHRELRLVVEARLLTYMMDRNYSESVLHIEDRKYRPFQQLIEVIRGSEVGAKVIKTEKGYLYQTEQGVRDFDHIARGLKPANWPA